VGKRDGKGRVERGEKEERKRGWCEDMKKCNVGVEKRVGKEMLTCVKKNKKCSAEC
jgi:hypothetical protein